MSTGMIPRWAAVLLAALLWLGGCAKDPEPGGAPPGESSMLIQPRVSVGKIRAGMTREQVIAELGPPGQQTANALEYPKLGLAVMPGPDGVIQVVMCGDVTGVNGPFVRTFTGRTKEGIGMKSSRAEVVRVYGEPSEHEAMRFGLESMKYGSLGLTFTLENGLVHHIIVRLGATPAEPSISVDTVPPR